MIKKLCGHCGDLFVTEKPAQRFCTGRHQRAAEKARYRARHIETTRCKGCGATFEGSTVDGRPKVYCDTTCQAESRSVEYQGRPDILENIARVVAARKS